MTWPAGGKADTPRPRVVQSLNALRTHDDLAGVRDAKALELLPESERTEWQRLWADVASLLGQLEDKPAGP
jgi:hypothetical protein